MIAFPESLATERLLLRRLRIEDLDDLVAFAQNERAMATLGGVKTADYARERLQKHFDHWSQHGFGGWSLRNRANEEFIGSGGLRHMLVEGTDEIELGYSLLPQYWGRGLAAEMSREALRLGFEVLQVQSIVAFTLPTNHPSRRVMEKIGMRFERDILWADLPHVLYRIDHATACQSTRSDDT